MLWEFNSAQVSRIYSDFLETKDKLSVGAHPESDVRVRTDEVIQTVIDSNVSSSQTGRPVVVG
jgi:hypothetical protein